MTHIELQPHARSKPFEVETDSETMHSQAHLQCLPLGMWVRRGLI